MSAVPPAQVAAWERLAAAATAGPWEWARDYQMSDGRHWCLIHPGNHARTVNWRTVLLATEATDFAAQPLDADPDLRFIAAARTAVPALCAEVRRLRTQLAECEAHCSDLIADAARFQAERDALRAPGAHE